LNACEIVNIVLGLEMKENESLLNLHKCASGTYYNSLGAIETLPEDPHVFFFLIYLYFITCY